MFFVLSKILTYLTMPLVIIVACLIFSALIKKTAWKKWSFRVGLGLLLFCTNDFIANEAMHAWEMPPVPYSQIQKKYEWAIVLTGVARSQVEPRDRVHFSQGATRATHTVQLYKLGIVKKILVSGGSGRLVNIGEREADELASALVMMGVAKDDILTENNSRNTYESAVEVKKLMAGRASPDQCLLVTSAFHMRRSLACFKKAGWEADTFSADILSHNRLFTFDTLFIPQLGAMGHWHVLTKEWMGMLAYRIAGYI